MEKKDESKDQTGESSDLFDVKTIRPSIKEKRGGGAARTSSCPVPTFTGVSKLVSRLLGSNVGCQKIGFHGEEEKGGLENILYTRWTSR